MNAALATEISRLTPAEKLQLLGELWADLSAHEDSIPIPDWHHQALAEDEARYQANPSEGSPWSDVKARVLRRS